MEQTKALNALEPFLALHKSATSSRAAADLIARATSAPNTYLFTELLSTPNIQALANTDFAAHLTVLQIFSYGTYAEYRADSRLPELNAAQKLKLRQLSLLNLARSRQNLTYDALKKHLELDDARELEDLVISAVYAGLLDATLDPHRAAVQVHSVAALRDLAPGAIPPMIASLKAWSGRCGNTLEDLEQQIEGIKSGAAQRAREKKEQDAEMEKLLAQATDEGSLELQPIGGGGGGGGGGGRRVVGNKNLRPKRPGPPEDEGAEAMDLDDDDDGMAKTRASRRKL